MTNSCEHIRELVSGSLDGVYLASGEAEALEAHLAGCAPCREHRLELSEARQLLRALPPEAAPPAALTAIHARLALTSPPDQSSPEPCERWAESISASLDMALLPAALGELEAHLELCAPCHRRRHTLAQWREALAGFELSAERPGQLTDLAARLDACRDEDLARTARPAPAWRLERALPLLKLAAAVLLFLGALSFLEGMVKRRPVNVRSNPGGRALAKAPESPAPGPSPERTPPLNEPEQPGQQTPEESAPTPTTPAAKPAPGDAVKAPATPKAPSPTPSTEGRLGAPEESRTKERAPPAPPPSLDLARLDALIRAVRARATPHGTRVAAIDELASFVHARCYGLFESLMSGELDALPRATELYPAATKSLAKLDTKESAGILLRSSMWLEKGKLDSPVVTRAIGRFRSRPAIRELARVACQDHDRQRSFLLLEGLGWRHNDAAEAVIREAFKARGRRRLSSSKERLVLLHRKMAITLGAIARGSSYATLASLLDPKARCETLIREGAALALATVRHKESLATLATVLDDRNSLVRSGAATALGFYRNPDAVRLLIGRLTRERSKTERARGAIRRALFRLTGERFGSAREWGDWLEQKEGELGAALGATTTSAAVSSSPQASFGIPMQAARRMLFMIDASASMSHGAKFEVLVSELRAALEALPPSARFNVLLFSDTARFLLSSAQGLAVKANVNNKARALRAITSQRARSAPTQLENAFNKAFSSRVFDVIYLISDGAYDPRAPLRPDALLLELAQWNRGRRLVIHTVGVFGSGDLTLDISDPEPQLDLANPVDFMKRLARDHQGLFVKTRLRLKKPPR